MKKVRPLEENFRDFMISAETHQKAQNPYVDEFMELGATLFDDLEDDKDRLPFDFERKPEIGEMIRSAKSRLEQMEALSQAGLNKINRKALRDNEISPYITRQFELAYNHLREGYLRLMDM